MKMRQLLCSAALGAVAVSLGLGAVSGSVQAQEKVSWHLSAWGNPREVTMGFEHIAEYVKEKTNGNFEIQLHYGETISPAKENLDAIKLGTLEMAMTCVSYHPGKNPLSTVLDLPFLPILDLEVERDVHEAVYAHPAIRDELKQWNALPWASLLLPPYEFMGTGKPPEALDDWKGKRVRALGGLGQAMQRIGAVPTSLPAPEVYSGLERGVIDAASFGYYAHGAYRLHEISKWYTMGMALGAPNCPLVVSISAWEALPAEYRELMEEAKPESYEVMIKAYKEADEKWLPVFDKYGLTRVTYSTEERDTFAEKAARPVWDAWVQENAGKGPTQELLDFVLAEAKKAAGS